MGLLELLQQGQTLLSVGAFPGDTPIYDPQSGFVQSNLSTNTYESETIGQPNNGSVLANTLDNTGLDNTLLPHDIDKPIPPPIANYPLLVSGEFNGAPLSPASAYNPSNTYLDNISINDPNSPQIGTLDQTGLDNTDNDAEFTAIIPNSISYPNNYPELVSGEFSGAPSPYESPYNVDNTYLSDVSIKDPDSPQLPTLSRTSLDNIDYARENTTSPIPNAGSYPNNYPIVSPQVGMGSFGLQPNQYYTTNAPGSGYYSQANYTDIITTSGNPLVAYAPQSGLSINNNGTAAFIQSYPFNQTYLGDPGFPLFVTGQFMGGPSFFQGLYNANNTYLSNTPIQSPNSTQTTTLSKTGLDNTEASAALSAIIPNSITYPNAYPLLTSGEFNGAPLQYASIYNSSSTYLDAVPIQDPNSPQIPTLAETGLDSTDSNSLPTTIVPDSISYPNNYPAIEGVNLGGFGGPEQYDTNWNQENTYLNSFTPNPENSIQLGFTGSNLDNSSTGVSTLSHVIPPTSTYKPNNYPVIPTVNLGEFNSGPSQYITPYTPDEPYLGQYDELKDIITNPQTNTLDETALDVENSAALPSSLLFAPTNPDDITIYPDANVTGIKGSAPQPFNQVWRPSNKYYKYMKENYEVR